MFIFGAVPDDMSFEFDPVSESSDEIEPQGEMGGFPGMGGEEDGAGGPDLPHAGRGGEVGDKPPRPRKTTTGAKGGARQLPFLLYRQR